MRQITEPLRPARVLDPSKKHKELRSFSCGRKGRVWELSVNGWAERVCRAETVEPQTILALEDANGMLLGLSSVKPRDLHPLLYREPLRGLPYVHEIGTDYRYHGVRLQDGSSPGDALLVATLARARDLWGGSLPHVWAYVHPDNKPSHDMFQRHGFGVLSPAGDGDAIRILAPF